MSLREVGEIKASHAKNIEWTIPNFSSIINAKSFRHYVSPKFPFTDVYWQLWLSPDSPYKPGYISIHLMADDKQKCSVEYYIGFKKCDGSVKLLTNGILNKKRYYSKRMYETRNTFLGRKLELLPDDVLTISCTLIFISEDRTDAIKLIKLDKLSENFKSIFKDKQNCDVTLKVNDKDYKAHKLVLTARSSVFAVNFKHDTVEKQTGFITIPDCDPDSFQEFLEYIYCGKLEQMSTSSAMNLYYTSDKYDVGELRDFCIEYLMQNLTYENICEVAVFADKYDQTRLFSAVQYFFSRNASEVSEFSKWEYFRKNNSRLANKLLVESLKFK